MPQPERDGQCLVVVGEGLRGTTEPGVEVLRLNGNMSSATVMFVLERMLEAPPGLNCCVMAFGPGLTAETMTYRTL